MPDLPRNDRIVNNTENPVYHDIANVDNEYDSINEYENSMMKDSKDRSSDPEEAEENGEEVEGNRQEANAI